MADTAAVDDVDDDGTATAPRMRLASALLVLTLGAAPALAQDAAAGERVYLKCRSCHQIGPGAQNQIGPAHNGLVGRRAGTYPGYSYSAANRNSGLVWDEATLREYLRDPKALVPGTKMIFPGIRDDRQISDLIAFLRQFDAQGNKLPATP